MNHITHGRHLLPVDLASTPRILARTLLHQGCISSLMLIDATGQEIRISHFDCETSNTIFLDATAMLLDGHHETFSWMIANLERYIASHLHDEHFLKHLCREISSQGLFDTPESNKGKLTLYRLA